MRFSHRQRLRTVAMPDNLTAEDGDHRARQRVRLRSRLFAWGPRGWAVVAFLSAGQLLLIGLAATSVNAPSQLLAVALLAPLPIVVGAAATAGWRRRRRREDLDELQSLASRVEMAEAILAREQERMHELRARVSSVALSHRLLTDRRSWLSRTTRWRLERLREAELSLSLIHI